MLYFSCSLDPSPSISVLSSLRVLVCRLLVGELQERSHSTLTSHVIAGPLILAVYSPTSCTRVSMCVSECVKNPSWPFLLPRIERSMCIRAHFMPLWLLLLTVSSWEHGGPGADLETCQARLWSRSVSRG